MSAPASKPSRPRLPPSVRRYNRRYGLSMAVYVAALLPMVWALATDHLPAAPWIYLAALLPALGIIGAVWALLRQLVELEDEYLRMVAVRTYIVATGLTFALCTVWGFLQVFAGVPKISLVWVFIINCGFQALTTAHAYWSWRGTLREPGREPGRE